MKTSRRNFIKAAGSLAALSVTPSFANIIIPQQRPLGVALVGLGYYSTQLLAPALQHTQYCKLTGIVTGSPWKIPVWQERYGIKDSNVYTYENMDKIAENPEIDIIYVVLPPSMHSEYSIRAAKAGKHVWCEKPMALNMEECQAMIDACNQNSVKLSIGYRMQHEPNTQRIIQFGREKTYGSISLINSEAGYFESRTNHWKQKKEMGGGAMYDMGVYPLNATRYVTGEEPILVKARHQNNRDHIYNEVDETTIFHLKFPSGAIANCQTSFGYNMNSLEVKCSKGSYGLTPFQAYTGIRGRTSDGKILKETIPNQQAKQMDDDAFAILNNKPVLVPGEEGLRDIKVVEAIFESAANDSAEIQLL